MSRIALSKTTYLLTGDIGGTNSRMSLYRADASCDDSPLVVKYYVNSGKIKDPSNPDEFAIKIVTPFIQHCWEADPDVLAPLEDSEIVACLAVAGTVTGNRVYMTNYQNLLIDGTAIEQSTENEYLQRIVACTIINDFVAQGYGCLTLHQHEVKQLFGPKITDLKFLPRGPKVCVGAGTGLGECYLTPTPGTTSSYECFPSEGGHVEYAPRNEEEIELFKFLSNKFASKHRISVERVVSGIGLANVYEFLSTKYKKEITPDIHKQFLNAGDEQGRVVGENATKAGSLFERAMKIMMSAYGCEVGSCAIKFIPTGGLFVTGGLTPKNIHFIEDQESEFMQSYRNKGRVSPLLDRVPLFAVMTEDLGVRGVHQAAKMINDERRKRKGPSSSTAGDPTTWQGLLFGSGVLVGVTMAVLLFRRR